MFDNQNITFGLKYCVHLLTLLCAYRKWFGLSF